MIVRIRIELRTDGEVGLIICSGSSHMINHNFVVVE